MGKTPAVWSYVELYIFGSLLHPNQCIGDVDLLVVYEDANDLSEVKSVLEDIALRIPLDVTFMHKNEEQELKFVSGQGAINVFEMWPNTLGDICPATRANRI